MYMPENYSIKPLVCFWNSLNTHTASKINSVVQTGRNRLILTQD
jgi:hypothetical protein